MPSRENRFKKVCLAQGGGKKWKPRSWPHYTELCLKDDGMLFPSSRKGEKLGEKKEPKGGARDFLEGAGKKRGALMGKGRV